MQYTKIKFSDGNVQRVAHDLRGWKRPYKELHEQTIAGWLVHTAYSHNKFDNKFSQADEERYAAKGNKVWGEIFRDIVRGRDKDTGEVPPCVGAVPVLYISDAGSPDEVRVKTWKLPIGLYVPVHDAERGYRFFVPKTLMPERIICFDRRHEAEDIFIQFGLPLKQISGFYHGPDDYVNQERYVRRIFDPDYLAGKGRFLIGTYGLPTDLGFGFVGSRPRYEEQEDIEEIAA